MWNDAIFQVALDLRNQEMTLQSIANHLNETYGTDFTGFAVAAKLTRFRSIRIKRNAVHALQQYHDELVTLYNTNMRLIDIVDAINEKYSTGYTLSQLRYYISSKRNDFEFKNQSLRKQILHKDKDAVCAPELNVDKICENIRDVVIRKKFKLLSRNGIQNLTHSFNGFLNCDKLDQAIKKLIKDGFLKPCSTSNTYEVQYAN